MICSTASLTGSVALVLQVIVVLPMLKGSLNSKPSLLVPQVFQLPQLAITRGGSIFIFAPQIPAVLSTVIASTEDIFGTCKSITLMLVLQLLILPPLSLTDKITSTVPI